ncbi:MAG: YitT family protein [Butyricicoccus sp.]|nr:YitT family protein [Butyricicoccus sp.]
MRRSYLTRSVLLLAGTALTALGVYMMLQANVGLEPWSVFHQGLELTIGISFGMASSLTGFLAILAAVIMRESFGIGTIINIVLCGVLLDVLNALAPIPFMTSTLPGVLLLFAGMLVLAVGTWLYMASELGSGPRDALTVALARKVKRSVGPCRVTMDCTVTVLGFLMGGKIGIGTVLAAVFVGWMIDLTFRIVRFRPTELQQENIAETMRNLLRR